VLPLSSVSAADHPLRPFPEKAPDDDISEEFLTPYCASRPTAVQSNTFDKREEKITLTVQGQVVSDFSSFVTPLLSITDQNKDDYSLGFDQKAQRYMADYLEGRAYYEPFAEPSDPSTDESRDILARSGVFRKLAPKTYQDKLKRLLIQRSKQIYTSLDQLEKVYGFRPASIYVNPKTPVQNLKLEDFYLNWAPLQEDFTTLEKYQSAYSAWELKDDGKWANLWPYVPMFTREDSKGLITTHDEPKQISTSQTAVYHPHLARTYEVSSTLSNLLSPQENHISPVDPKLSSDWITPAPWNGDLFWIESGQNVPSDYGPVCDPKNTIVSSSGDLALDKSLETNVDSLKLDKQYIEFDNPRKDYKVRDKCGEHWSCESCTEGYDDINQRYTYFLDTNSPECFYTVPVRFSPTYLETKTPYLAQIMDRLSTGPTALFNIFKTSLEIDNDPPENWPGLGYEDEENPKYSFSNGPAEAGLKKPEDKAKYYYKYLGYLQCQKEKILARLLPEGQYQSFSSDCFPQPEDTSLSSTCSGDYPQAEPACAVCNIDAGSQYMANVGYPEIPEKMKAIFEAAAQKHNVPAAIIMGTMFSEGGFNRRECYGEWTDEIICSEEIPSCRECNISNQGATGPYQIIPTSALSDINPCNFESATFATASLLAKGKAGFGVALDWPDSSCPAGKYGEITYNTPAQGGSYATSCTNWTIKDIVTTARAYRGICDPAYFETIVDFWKFYSC